MKTFRIDIHPELKDVEISVKNGAAFERAAVSGKYQNFKFTPSEEDVERIKKFAVKHSNDKRSNQGNWYAHCNGYAMDLAVTNAGKFFYLNTYRSYGRPSF